MYEIHKHDSVQPLGKALVLDTALYKAREMSIEHKAMVSVVDVHGHERTIRAFAERGVVFWVRTCPACRNHAKERDFCLECDSVGYVQGDTLTP